jgi:hypothetical protein
METKEGLLAVCSSMQGYTVGTEGTHIHARLDLLENLVDISLLEKKLNLLDKTQLAEQETEAVNLFFLALRDTRQIGGAYDSGDSDE